MVVCNKCNGNKGFCECEPVLRCQQCGGPVICNESCSDKKVGRMRNHHYCSCKKCTCIGGEQYATNCWSGECH